MSVIGGVVAVRTGAQAGRSRRAAVAGWSMGWRARAGSAIAVAAASTTGWSPSSVARIGAVAVSHGFQPVAPLRI
ncbi:hypothetical protein [Streptomyces sp. NPDC056663]|uniref:hypothetical protein n=1 Tax=Streptomyces sp. NPDC056663 TaxID=3345899 RepID=UPI003698CC27